MKVQISREKNKHEFRHPMLKILYEDAYLIVVEKRKVFFLLRQIIRRKRRLSIY